MAKCLLHVGGLADQVTAETITAAFTPFGTVLDVNMPLDGRTGTHRGFCFVLFEEPEDAEAAVDNMDQAELYGRVIRVSVADKDDKTLAIWNEELAGVDRPLE